MSLPGYATRALTLHNSLRADHNSPPLEWSSELHMAAQRHAVALVNRRAGEKLAPKSDLSTKWGQNVFELTSPVKWLVVPENTAVEKAIRSWYDGVKTYNWTNPMGVGADKSCLNFTQMIWRETRRVGIGFAASKDGQSAVVVGFYDPQGNIRGLFPSNVQRKGQSSSSGSTDFGLSGLKISSSPSPRSTTSGTTSSASYRQTTTSSSSSSSYGGQSTVVEDEEDLPLPLAVAVELHNQYRSKHGVPMLKLDWQLCDKANNFATNLAKGKSPPSSSEIGCNIYRVEDPNLDPVEAVRLAVTKWYGQSKNYKWSSPMTSKLETRLFAQLVWKSTKTFGVGMACQGNVVAVVALYAPIANMASEQNYMENVRYA